MLRTVGSPKLSLILLAGVAILSAFLFYRMPTNLLCLLPMLAYCVWRFLPLAGERADQHFIIAFVILCLGLDDLSQVAWGRDIETLTEQLGAILFQSFGITGLEAFSFLFAAWLLLVRSQAQVAQWVRMGLLPLLLLSVSIFFSSALAGFIGMQSGGDITTYFIQTRFLHLFPFWAFIGFVVMRDQAIVDRLSFWISLIISLKSLQGLFVYFTNRETLADAEYLIDHYFSAFSVLAMLGLIRAFKNGRSLWIRALLLVPMLAVLATYVLNDRRTSYIGVVLATAMLIALLPWSWLKHHIAKLLLVGASALIFIIATWNMPPPLGFVGATYRSFGTEGGGDSGPSYRELENANLLNAVVQAPVTGIGYGKEFDEVFKMQDISQVYERYRMIPHNLFLAGWAYGGPLTLAMTSLVFAFMIGIAGRLIHKGPQHPHFFLGVLALFYAVQYFTYTFGDLGLQIPRNQVLSGLLVGACYRILRESERGAHPWGNT